MAPEVVPPPPGEPIVAGAAPGGPIVTAEPAGAPIGGSGAGVGANAGGLLISAGLGKSVPANGAGLDAHEEHPPEAA